MINLGDRAFVPGRGCNSCDRALKILPLVRACGLRVAPTVLLLCADCEVDNEVDVFRVSPSSSGASLSRILDKVPDSPCCFGDAAVLCLILLSLDNKLSSFSSPPGIGGRGSSASGTRLFKRSSNSDIRSFAVLLAAPSNGVLDELPASRASLCSDGEAGAGS